MRDTAGEAARCIWYMNVHSDWNGRGMLSLNPPERLCTAGVQGGGMLRVGGG